MNKFTPTEIKTLLLNSIDTILEDKNQFLMNPEKNFARVQKISFRQTMLYPIISQTESTSVEMLDFFPEKELPSAPALTYRRNQIRQDAFIELFRRFTSTILRKNLFHGMRLIACDGSRLNTPYNPKDKESYVKCIKERRGFNQLHLNTCYDILNDCFLDAVIQGYHSMDEGRAFCQMMDRYSLEEPALFIADRNYFSFNVISHAFHNHHHFLIRLKKYTANTLFHDRKDLTGAETFDVTDEINVGRRRTKKLKSLRNHHFIPDCRRYDFLQAKSDAIETFKLRLLKVKISENTIEYLMTNLPEDQFSIEDLTELYRSRWTIETSYRYLKYPEGLTHIHSLKGSFIHQEIYAKLIGYNFCAAVYHCLKKTENTKSQKYTYVYDKTYLIKLCIRFLKNKVRDIKTLMKRKKVPVRADRQFERNMRRQCADTLLYR